MNTKKKLFQDETRRQLTDCLSYFFKWMIVASVIGIVGGLVGILFHKGIEEVTLFRESHGWMLCLLPFAGLLIVFLYHCAGMKNDRGTNLVLDSVHTQQQVPFRMTLLILAGTILTHLCGGSAGREGAALQIGGSLGSTFGKLIRFQERDRRILVMCGMSAVFTAMFGTPITAAVFSMEVVSVGILYYGAFVPCITSAAVAYSLMDFLGAHATRYTLDTEYVFSIPLFLKIVLLAILCGLLGIVLCMALHKTSHISKEKIPNDYIRIFAGGVIIILLTLLVGNNYYNGAGGNLIETALHGEMPHAAFLWKIIFTAVTMGMGYKGGEIVPTLFIGAAFGNFIGPILGIDVSLAAAVCMVALFCAVVNCPIASLLLALEVFGRADLLLFAAACGVSYFFSGYYSLYSSQTIVYDKTGLERVERPAR